LKTLIKDITNIQTGLFAKPSGMGELVYLQSKHFDEYGQLHAVLHPDLLADSISEKHLLKDGDVLFAAKGTKNFATVYEKHNLPAVASTSFFVIRLSNKMILPHYLAWYLNSLDVQQILKSKAMGTSIVSISKSTLEDLEIKIPSIEKQKIILKIEVARKQEIKLNNKLQELKQHYIHTIISKSLK
jgi:hypothetical protein